MLTTHRSHLAPELTLWGQVCGESLGTSALLPPCCRHWPLNAVWQGARSGAQLHCHQANLQVRVRKVGGLLHHSSTSSLLSWQENGTTLVETSFHVEVSVRKAWKKSICSAVCKRTAVS